MSTTSCFSKWLLHNVHDLRREHRDVYELCTASPAPLTDELYEKLTEFLEDHVNGLREVINIVASLDLSCTMLDGRKGIREPATRVSRRLCNVLPGL